MSTISIVLYDEATVVLGELIENCYEILQRRKHSCEIFEQFLFVIDICFLEYHDPIHIISKIRFEAHAILHAEDAQKLKVPAVEDDVFHGARVHPLIRIGETIVEHQKCAGIDGMVTRIFFLRLYCGILSLQNPRHELIGVFVVDEYFGDDFAECLIQHVCRRYDGTHRNILKMM